MNNAIEVIVCPAANLPNSTVQRLVELFNQAFLRHSWLLPGNRIEVESFREEAINNELIMFKAPEEAIIGMALIHPEGESLYFAVAAIDPAWQNKGYGSRLVQTAEEIARERGLKKLKLRAAVEIGNVAYYLRRGFKIASEEIKPQGTWGSLKAYNVATMEKELV